MLGRKRQWETEARFLGEIVEDNYILKTGTMIPPTPRIPKVPPVLPIPPIPSMDQTAERAKLGWVDALAILMKG